ncbi:hypothetical protein RISK_002102 [Rhodopirellula islandica]|uniref:Uncharacterized protein n=1 Tax=Rhodopirellula islandica TaxID=595434 RepID=A0A0J1BFZ7_RHOIS|nr:hypothetical protein RISK_002102 [Rhodopirellula islandica]
MENRSWRGSPSRIVWGETTVAIASSTSFGPSDRVQQALHQNPSDNFALA